MLGLVGFFVRLILFLRWTSKCCLLKSELKRSRKMINGFFFWQALSILQNRRVRWTQSSSPSRVQEQVLQNWELIFCQKVDDLTKNGQISYRNTLVVCSYPSVNIVLRGPLEHSRSTLCWSDMQVTTNFTQVDRSCGSCSFSGRFGFPFLSF